MLEHSCEGVVATSAALVREVAVWAAHCRKSLGALTSKDLEDISKIRASTTCIELLIHISRWHSCMIIISPQIVLATRFWVLKFLIGLLHILELLVFGFFLAGVFYFVWMQNFCEFLVAFLDFMRCGVFFHSQNFVVVFAFCLPVLLVGFLHLFAYRDA